MALFNRKPAGLGDQIKTVLENLCNLEINTIVKDNMTGQKMPAPERALLELAEHYDAKLIEHGSPRTSSAAITGGPTEFAQTRERAARLVDAWSSNPALPADHQSELMILYRIRDTSEQIGRIFDAAAKRGHTVGDFTSREIDDHPIELAPDELVAVHKAWDLDLEQIALQTVIHLDGDVTHRVSPRYAGSSNGAPLLSAHDAALRTSISYWKTLVEIVGEFLSGAARTLGQRG